MRKTRKRRNTRKKSNGLLIGSIISVIILLSILGVLAYKNWDLIIEKVEEWQTSFNAVSEPEVQEKPVAEPTSQQPKEELPLQPVEQAPAVEKPVEKPKVELDEGGYIKGVAPPTEPTYINGVLIVNKQYPLPQSYNKGEDPEARAAFEKMREAALIDGHELVAFSGFRSYEYQTTLYNNYVQRDGKEAADRYSARPGFSEHQTGLAFDIGEKKREDLWLTSEFGETPAGKWLVDHAHLHGFILRYPKGKEDKTGFMYESWHFRYLGMDLAQKVHASGVTLEEYLTNAQ